MESTLLLIFAGLLVAGAGWIAYQTLRTPPGSGLPVTSHMQACRVLLALTAQFQQHRGMSSALLSGDEDFAVRLRSKADEIAHSLAALRPVARAESLAAWPCLQGNDLALFEHRWQTLRDKLPTLTVDQSIAQHSVLISQLLHWLAAFGEARLEPLLGGDAARGKVRNYALRLPALTECLGQARAIGMSVATRKGCSAVARVRLMFLVARAETLVKQAAESAAPGLSGQQAILQVQQMARLIRTQMLVSAGLAVTVEAYFSAATAAIDGVFRWIEETGSHLLDVTSVQGHREGVSLGHVS